MGWHIHGAQDGEDIAQKQSEINIFLQCDELYFYLCASRD